MNETQQLCREGRWIFGFLQKQGTGITKTVAFEDAVKFLQRAHDEVTTFTPEYLSIADRINLEFKLGVALLRTDNLQQAKQTLLGLTELYMFNYAETYLQNVEFFNVLHMLAEVHRKSDELDEAESACVRAMRARKQLLGEKHTSYHDSVSLLVAIYNAKEETGLASHYAAYLPTAQPVSSQGTDKTLFRWIRDSLGLDSSAPGKAEGLNKATDLQEDELSDNSTTIANDEAKPPHDASKANTFSDHLQWSHPVFQPLPREPFRIDTQAAISTLLANGMDVKSSTFDPYAALFWAAQTGNAVAASFLLLSLGEIAAHKKVKVMDVNRKHRIGLTALHIAAAKGHADVARVLIAHHADMNMPTSRKAFYWTPLMLAVLTEQPRGINPVLSLLLESGADVDARHLADNGTALTLAVYFRRINSLNKLLEFGPDLEVEPGLKWRNLGAMVRSSAARRTALSLRGRERDHMESLGFKACNSPKYYSRPLLVAAKSGQWEAVKLLLEKGAVVDAVHRNGRETALKGSVYYDHLGVTQLLLDHGASLKEHPNGQGESAVVTAWKYFPAIFDLLHERGVDLQPLFKIGITQQQIDIKLGRW